MKTLIAGMMAAAASVAFADGRPVLSVTRAEQRGKMIYVDYTVDRDAVVTFNMVTNGVELAGVWTSTQASGDVFKKVSSGSHSFSWKAYHAELENFELKEPVGKIRVKAWALDAPPPYAVLACFGSLDYRATYYENAEQVPGGVLDDRYLSECLLFRKVPAAYATFRMGTPEGMVGRQSGETETLVTLTNDYYLSVFPMTGFQASRFAGDGNWEMLPRVGKSFDDLRGTAKLWPADGYEVSDGSFLAVMRARTGLPFDLPTRAQWEFAARGGSSASLYDGSELTCAEGGTDAALDPLAWYGYNTMAGNACQLKQPGLKEPNGYGLYDMLGLVWEWVRDAGSWTLPGGTVVEPSYAGPEMDMRMACGGAYDANPQDCRMASVKAVYRFYSAGSGVDGIVNKHFGIRLWLPAQAYK